VSTDQRGVGVEILAQVLYARDADHLIRIGWSQENESLKGEYRQIAREVLDRIAVASDEKGRS
jgi:hypothetical protein